jgi:hypothetical protein
LLAYCVVPLYLAAYVPMFTGTVTIPTAPVVPVHAENDPDSKPSLKTYGPPPPAWTMVDVPLVLVVVVEESESDVVVVLLVAVKVESVSE